jgi:hypothetical protein
VNGKSDARTSKSGFRCKPICSALARSTSPIRSPPPTASVSTGPDYRPKPDVFPAHEETIMKTKNIVCGFSIAVVLQLGMLAGFAHFGASPAPTRDTRDKSIKTGLF